MFRKYCTNQLVECLQLIIYKDKYAIRKLRQCEKKIGVEIYTTPLEFDVPATSTKPDDFFRVFDTPLCDCWFEHEYFDYLQNGRCDMDMFTRVCSNIEQGQCEHTEEDNLMPYLTARVFLIHAAVATNNTKVTKYISRQILRRTSKVLNHLKTELGSLTAAHIAVVKKSNNALQYVVRKCAYPVIYENILSRRLRSSVFSNLETLAKRNDLTGKVEISGFPFQNTIVSLFKLYGNPSHLDILIQFIPVLFTHDMDKLMNIFLATRNEDLAVVLLNDRRVADIDIDSSILLNALFTHSHEFVRNWIKQKKNMLVEVNHQTIHVLSLAKALGCQKCLSLIDRRKNESQRTVYDMCMSLNVSPYSIAFYAAERFAYDTDALLDILKNLFYKGSCSLNKTNNSSDSVLHVLIQSDFCSKEVVECLLDLGSDVNATDVNGRTPLHVVIDSVDHSNDVVRCLLENGADVNLPDESGNTPFLLILRAAARKRSIPSWLFHRETTAKAETYYKRLKEVLYFNPRVDLHSDISEYLLKFDQNETLSDRELGLFVAMLFEMGFTNYRYLPPENFITGLSIRRDFFPPRNRQILSVLYQQFTSQPRSLQSICRVRIRKAFPGFQLHKMLKVVKMPKAIREYILFQNSLCYDKVNEN